MKKYNSVWMFLLLVVSINVFGKTLNKKDEIENSVISYQLAIYIPKFDLESIEEVAISLFKKQNSEFELVKEINLNLTTPQMMFQVLNDAQFDYAPPSVKMIDYFGRGITDEQAEEIQTIQKVLIINVAYNNENSWDRLQSVQFYTASIAKVLRGYVWDEETKEIFSIEEYINRRFFNPKLGAPSMQLHTVIHSYPEGNYVRAITLGMAKIGLPDIVINEFSWSRSSGVANAIVAITQLLAEGNRLNENNEFNLDLSKIKNEQYKSKLDDLLFENAKLKGIHQFNIAKVEEGDPNNLILEPIFKNEKGESKEQNLEIFLNDVFGWKDEITYIKHNQEILGASSNAKEKLPELKRQFNDGLKPGEYILLKAPFKTDDNGNEWMWVEVSIWNETTIKGTLNNEPFHISNLKAGATVDISQDDVFDYIRYYVDGTSEGNETGKLISKFQDK